MKTVEISRSQFLEDREKSTVSEMMEKYELNTAQYYKLLESMGIEKRKSAERKIIQVVD